MNQKDNLVMAKNCVYKMDENSANNNVLIVGGTGSGKTHYVLEPMLLHTENSSLVININKRSLFDKYAPLFAERGYKVLDLNIAHSETSNVSFNLFQYLKTDKDIRDFAINIVNASLGDKDNQKDPYWSVSAANLLAFVVRFTRDCFEKPDLNFFFCVVNALNVAFELLHSEKTEFDEDEQTSIDILKSVDFYAAKRCEASMASGYYGFRRNCRNTGICIIATMISAINAVFTEEVVGVISASLPELDITALGKEKTVLFITVPPLNQSTHIFSNIVFSQIFKDLFEYAEDHCVNGELSVPVRLMFDDFACGGVVPGFEKTISIIRQKKISVTMLLQDFSQLNSMYGDKKAQTISNNCDTLVYMGGMDEASVEKVSRLSNQPFEDVFYMPIDKVVVIRRGNKGAVFTSKYDIDADEIYKTLMKVPAKDKASVSYGIDFVH